VKVTSVEAEVAQKAAPVAEAAKGADLRAAEAAVRRDLLILNPTSLNAQQIINKFQTMVSDSLDSDFTLELANDAMHDVEEDVNPEGRKAVSEAFATFVGMTYTTALSLPADFYLPCDTIYVGDTPLIQVPFDRAVDYRDTDGFFYIDNANGNYHLTGVQTSVQTITFPYRAASPDLVLTPIPNSPLWPNRFHRLIPLKMAEMYYPIDGSERGRSWDDKWQRLYERGLNSFRNYDASLKLAAIGGSASPVLVRSSAAEDRIDLDN
jgi:hypothetical protein